MLKSASSSQDRASGVSVDPEDLVLLVDEEEDTEEEEEEGGAFPCEELEDVEASVAYVLRNSGRRRSQA